MESSCEVCRPAISIYHHADMELTPPAPSAATTNAAIILSRHCNDVNRWGAQIQLLTSYELDFNHTSAQRSAFPPRIQAMIIYTSKHNLLSLSRNPPCPQEISHNQWLPTMNGHSTSSMQWQIIDSNVLILTRQHSLPPKGSAKMLLQRNYLSKVESKSKIGPYTSPIPTIHRMTLSWTGPKVLHLIYPHGEG